jgi:hypothetical protein
MKILRALVVLALVAAVVVAVVRWQQIEQLRSDNEALRAELQRLNQQQQAAAAAQAQSRERMEELERLRAEARDVFKLRNEVAQLRSKVQTLGLFQCDNRHH